MANRDALFEKIGPVLKRYTVAEWVARLDEAGVPSGPVLSLDQVLTHPQVLARGMVVEQAHPAAGKIRATGVPVRLSETPGAVGSPPPMLGEHTREVLEGLVGLSPEEVARLEGEGVV